MSRIKIKRSSGNVFHDLGFAPAEAKTLLLRAQLLSEIRAAVQNLTRARAAQLFGVTQPRLNNVLQGRIDEFSLDELVGMLAKAGMRVEIRVEKSARTPRLGRGRASPPLCDR